MISIRSSRFFMISFFFSLSIMLPTLPKSSLRAFVKESVKNLKEKGALTPTSRYTGQEAVCTMRQGRGPKRILEVGAGIGNITELIVQELCEDDTLDVIEIDPVYCDVLREKFKAYPNVTIHNMDFTKFNPGYTYDHIISTVPHTSLPTEVVKAILQQYITLIKDRGTITYVEYIGFSKVTYLLKWGLERKLYKEKIALMKEFQATYARITKKVFRNLPPIFVHHLVIDLKKHANA